MTARELSIQGTGPSVAFVLPAFMIAVCAGGVGVAVMSATVFH